MKLILILAWRNIWRNWRRSLLTILAIFFAVFLSVIMRGFQKGTYKSNIELATSIFSGDIQIQEEGFQDNPSLRKSFRYDDEIIKKIEDTKHLNGYAPRIYSFGLIGFGDNSTGAAIFGIDPEHEKDV